MSDRKRVVITGHAPPFWGDGMYYVYVLKSEQHQFIYTGRTPDVARRMQEHNAGRVQSTAHYAPFRLVYVEAYANRADAVEREWKLKHHGSVIGHLKKRLKHSLTSERARVLGA